MGPPFHLLCNIMCPSMQPQESPWSEHTGDRLCALFGGSCLPSRCIPETVVSSCNLYCTSVSPNIKIYGRKYLFRPKISLTAENICNGRYNGFGRFTAF